MNEPVGLALFGLLVGLGFMVEATLGFGSAMIGLSLGSLFWPVQELIPLQVALGLCVSTYIVGRYHGDIAGRHLWRVYLPPALLGLPAGMLLATRLAGAALDRLFGALVLTLAALQLGRALLGGRSTPLGKPLRALALLGAGIMHGLYAIGGPLVVYVTSREPFAKGTFRATLSALWLVLGAVLFAHFLWSGRLQASAGVQVAWLLVPVAIGTRVGEWLHHRVSEKPFRLAVLSLLVLIGGKLALA